MITVIPVPFVTSRGADCFSIHSKESKRSKKTFPPFLWSLLTGRTGQQRHSRTSEHRVCRHRASCGSHLKSLFSTHAACVLSARKARVVKHSPPSDCLHASPSGKHSLAACTCSPGSQQARPLEVFTPQRPKGRKQFARHSQSHTHIHTAPCSTVKTLFIFFVCVCFPFDCLSLEQNSFVDVFF